MCEISGKQQATVSNFNACSIKYIFLKQNIRTVSHVYIVATKGFLLGFDISIAVPQHTHKYALVVVCQGISGLIPLTKAGWKTCQNRTLSQAQYSQIQASEATWLERWFSGHAEIERMIKKGIKERDRDALQSYTEQGEYTNCRLRETKGRMRIQLCAAERLLSCCICSHHHCSDTDIVCASLGAISQLAHFPYSQLSVYTFALSGSSDVIAEFFILALLLELENTQPFVKLYTVSYSLSLLLCIRLQLWSPGLQQVYL